MDLLASFQLEDLPEQQTRIVDLMKRHPDFESSLGFDACCTCGKAFLSPDEGTDCPQCHRVRYCSAACREQDATATVPALVSNTTKTAAGENSAEGDSNETALGHSPVICAILNLCNDDEAIDDEDNDNNPQAANLDGSRREAAQDRVRSEKESYPATLANAIAEGPCYQDVLKACSSRKRLVLHVIGASVESEFWKDASETSPTWDAYAEALTELADTRHLDVMEVIFVGPECPDQNVETSRSMKSLAKEQTTCGELLIKTYKTLYNLQALELLQIPKADIAIFFNPGFTVPDYDWNDALACIPKETPFLSTTNTELEGIADCQYLLDQDRIQTMPPGLADIFGLHSPGDDDEAEDEDAAATTTTTGGTAFFTVNPFAGSRVRQSGTMANDLYVKNRWMLGGILDSFDPSKAVAEASSKRQRTTSVPSNDKRTNPALI